MIRINLLSDRDAIQKETTRQQISIYVLSIVLTVVIAGGIHFTLYQKKKGIQEEIRGVEEALKGLKERVGEVERYKQFKKDLETKLSVIKDLQKNKILAVQLLDTLSQRIPEQMWLAKVLKRGNEMTLEGYAIDNETIANFMKGLEGSPFINNIELSLTENKDIEGIGLKHFLITTMVQTSPPQKKVSELKGIPPTSGEASRADKGPSRIATKESP